MEKIVPIEQIIADLATMAYTEPQSGPNIIMGLLDQIRARDALIQKLYSYGSSEPIEGEPLPFPDGYEDVVCLACKWANTELERCPDCGLERVCSNCRHDHSCCKLVRS